MSDARLRVALGACGVVGPLLLVAYFTAPVLVAFPSSSAGSGEVAAFAEAHRTLLLVGGWLLATGTMASLMFFLGLVHLARAVFRLNGMATLLGAASLLALSLTEAVLLMAAPLVAADQPAIAATTLQLAVNSQVFVHAFPLAPAPLVLIGLGVVLRAGGLLPQWLATGALALGAAFLLAGLAVQFTSAALLPTVVVLGLEEIWTFVAAVTFLAHTRVHALAGS